MESPKLIKSFDRTGELVYEKMKWRDVNDVGTLSPEWTPCKAGVQALTDALKPYEHTPEIQLNFESTFRNLVASFKTSLPDRIDETIYEDLCNQILYEFMEKNYCSLEILTNFIELATPQQCKFFFTLCFPTCLGITLLPVFLSLAISLRDNPAIDHRVSLCKNSWHKYPCPTR